LPGTAIRRQPTTAEAQVVAAVAALVLAVATGLVVGLGAGTATAVAALAGTAVALALAILFVVVPHARSLWPEGRLVREALLVRERARYTATRREASEVGGEGGRGLVARASISRERELIERPATLSSLVNDFRALAAEAGRVTGRVVIAIDELDKMADPGAARDLLRDIKGIFEVPGVHFLVSISDEAARNLSLGALTERNEFNMKALEEEALTLRREVITALDGEGVAPLRQDVREGAFLGIPDDRLRRPGGLRRALRPRARARDVGPGLERRRVADPLRGAVAAAHGAPCRGRPARRLALDRA
jgi:hypothetical protein